MNANLQETELSRVHEVQTGFVAMENFREGRIESSFEIKAERIVEHASLRFAHLNGANLRGSHMAGADLSSTLLVNTNLQEADLQSANLSGAILRGASLQGTVLKDTNLTGVMMLTQDQLNAADGDDQTRLPYGLTRPAHWPKAKANEGPLAPQPDNDGRAPAADGAPGSDK